MTTPAPKRWQRLSRPLILIWLVISIMVVVLAIIFCASMALRSWNDPDTSTDHFELEVVFTNSAEHQVSYVLYVESLEVTAGVLGPGDEVLHNYTDDRPPSLLHRTTFSVSVFCSGSIYTTTVKLIDNELRTTSFDLGSCTWGDAP